MSGRLASQSGIPENKIVRSHFCTELAYVLNRQGTDYHALFNDPPSSEQFVPIGGVPRPDPDLADRTKYFAVPTGLQEDYPERVTPSRFSGKMREAAGCYYARGESIPFRHAYDKTHGIVWAGSVYWLVEISAQGVYATRIKVGADCCSSWYVTHLMPTDGEIKASPGLREYRSKISLAWYRTFRGGSVVKQLLAADQIAAAYQAGAPWCADHGWAFSASGAQAQTVVVSTSLSPVECYVGARFRLSFQVIGTGGLTAAFSVLEADKKFTLMRDRTVWSPVIPGSWNGALGSIGGAELDALPAQDAPIHVYYVGETERLTRWQLTLTVLEEVNTIPIFGRVPLPLIEPEVRCYGSFLDPYSPGFQLLSGEHINGYRSVNCGYTGPGFTYVGDTYSRGTRVVAEKAGDVITGEPTPWAGVIDLNPICYFDDGGSLVTNGAAGGFQVDTHTDYYSEQIEADEGIGTLASVVLFMEEREAILAVKSVRETNAGVAETTAGTKNQTGEKLWTTVTSHGGAFPGISYDVTFAGSGSPASRDYSSSTVFDEHSGSGAATLALGDLVVPIELATSPLDDVISDFNFQTFLECAITTKTSATSAVSAMRGNVDAEANHAYYLESMTVVDGFPYASGEVVAFIGGL